MHGFNLRDSERTAVFIDGANLYATARAVGWDVDYTKLRQYLEEQCNLIRCFYYTAVFDDRPDPLRKLTDFLAFNGYTMNTKPAKVFFDKANQVERVKGNMDIEIAIDMMKMAKYLNHIILFSGDGDFRRLIEEVQSAGLKVTVVSILDPMMIAQELRKQADYFVDLRSLEKVVKRDYRAAIGPLESQPNAPPA